MYIVIPVVIAQIVRRSLLARGGEEALDRLLAKLRPLSLAAPLATLVLLFGFQGEQIIVQPMIIALLATPILIQVYFNAGLACLLNRSVGEQHCVAGPSALIGASNFFKLAVVAAISLFRFHSGAPVPVMRIAKRVLALVVLAAPSAGAIAAANSKPGNSEITIRLSDGSRVTLKPFRSDKKLGLAEAQCGVTIGNRRIVVMWADGADAYTCRGLVGAGLMPPGNLKERIGLIYDVTSPNAAFRTAVLLVRDPDGWSLDKASIGQYDDTPEAQSLKVLADALSK